MSTTHHVKKVGIAGVLVLFGLASPLQAQDFLVRGANGAYQAPRLGTPPGERLRVGDVPAGTTRGIYDQQGRRVGTYEQKSYGGVVYDNQGRRR